MENSRVEEILKYWFGHVEETALPSAHRTEVWFGGKKETDDEVKEKFTADLQNALAGKYADWEKDPHSYLALIIIFDQFSRHIYRNTPQAFAQDQMALDLCLRGVQQEFDHALSLIERVFFYFPLMHSESLEMQSTSVRAYQILVNLSFPETRSVYENFLEYAVKHYEIVRRFGRFPHRNILLGRPSTAEELEYLKSSPSPFGD